MNGHEINGSQVTEKKLTDLGYKKYLGKEMDIYFNKDVCQHSAKCLKGNPAVFNVDKKPWILADNGDTKLNVQVIDTCPSGALKYIVKEG